MQLRQMQMRLHTFEDPTVHPFSLSLCAVHPFRFNNFIIYLSISPHGTLYTRSPATTERVWPNLSSISVTLFAASNHRGSKTKLRTQSPGWMPRLGEGGALLLHRGLCILAIMRKRSIFFPLAQLTKRAAMRLCGFTSS